MASKSRHGLFVAISDEARAVRSTNDWFGCRVACQEPGVVLNAAIYTICFSFLTNAALGSALMDETDGEMGVTEAFTSSALTGIFMVLVGGQPVVLYGQTGPVVLLYAYVYSIAKTYDIPYGPFVAWIGLFAFIMHTILAAFGTCDFKKLVSAFTEEIFATLVAADFITTAVLGFAAGFGTKALNCVDPAHCVINGLFTLILGLCFYSLALKLGGLQKKVRWSSGRLLRFVSEYYLPLALVVTTLISYFPSWANMNGWPSAGVPRRIEAPTTWGLPTGHDFLTFRRMGEVPGWAIAAALVPAFLLTVLFYVDQNLSAMMAVGGGGLCKCKAPEAFNLEFFFLGVTVLFTGMLGLPASSGLIPQNPMHTRALTVRTEIVKEIGAAAEEEGDANAWHDIGDDVHVNQDITFTRQVTTTTELAIVGPLPTTESSSHLQVVEQRFSGLLHSVCLGVVVFILPVLGWIPLGVLWGGFLLLASEAYDFQFIQRLLLCLTSPSMRIEKREKFPDLLHVLDAVPYRTMLSFTLLQLALWLMLYIVAVLLKDIFPVEEGNTWVMVGAIFPVLVCIYAVPIRTHLIPKLFSEADLRALDYLHDQKMSSDVDSTTSEDRPGDSDDAEEDHNSSV